MSKSILAVAAIRLNGSIDPGTMVTGTKATIDDLMAQDALREPTEAEQALHEKHGLDAVDLDATAPTQAAPASPVDTASIFEAATKEAAGITDAAKADADKLATEAKADADKLATEAKAEADKVLDAARAEADKIIAAAKDEAAKASTAAKPGKPGKADGADVVG